ncbi:MAG: DUF2341 domain-containing protein, partial [Lentisphaerae bacterium]|nr:DUF2341 domain-containing protein [Lentisphaerota bacterium]
MRLKAYTLLILIVLVVIGSAFSDEDLSLWLKHMTKTFSGYDKSETLTDFPALIVLEETDAGVGFYYTDFLSLPYDDLRFATEDKETQLDFEVESWNINGKSYVWVRIPELTQDTKIHAFRGKAGVVVPDVSSLVWEDSYKCVWHLNGNTDDSTVNENHATSCYATPVSGLMGNAYDFVPANSAYIDTPSNVK